MKYREDELIESLIGFFRSHNRILVGPGDDAAILSEIPTMGFVVTVDAQTEGVHFKRGFLSLNEIGHRSLASALSDLAAMGALPLTFLVNLEVPLNLEAKDAIAIYEGFKKLSEEFCISPVGGNVVQGSRISLVTTVLGELPRERRILRSGAKPGDLVALTGDIGRTLAGLEILKNPERFPLISSGEREKILEKFRRPFPRVKEMQNILELLSVHSSIDISDGLGIDLGRMARLSDVSFHLEEEKLPISKEVQRVASELGTPPWKLAVASGEEFEIAFTFPEDELREFKKLGFPVAIVGKVKEAFSPDVVIETSTGEVSIMSYGYDQISGWQKE